MSLSLADQLRVFVERNFREGSARAYNLLKLADQIEQVENRPSLAVAPENDTP